MTGLQHDSIDHLEITWASIAHLCESLSEAEWKTATGCPGWTVQDNIAHLIDYESRALGRPAPQHEPSDVSHTKNSLGASNEIGIDARRHLSGREVLAEFTEITTDRLQQLRSLSAVDLAREIVTPAGPGTLETMLTLRVMDTWSHEQDIRRALHKPGHDRGPAVLEAVTYLAQFLPIVVVKRAGAPDATTVVIAVDDVVDIAIGVANGRGSIVADAVEAPTVRIAMPAPTFAALTGGRTDIPHDVRINGNQDLGQAIVNAMGFLP
jgi:uncharacterized protein (TIGR03083 family)